MAFFLKLTLKYPSQMHGYHPIFFLDTKGTY